MVSSDAQLEHWIAAHRAGFLDEPFRLLTDAGTHGLLWLGLALIVAGYRRTPPLLATVAVADLVAELLADGLKLLTDRARPHVSRLIAEPHSSSFPSGHAATSFACATVIALLAPRLRLPALALAAAVAYARLYLGVHFPTDVLAGAALGVLVGVTTVRLAGRRGRDPKSPGTATPAG